MLLLEPARSDDLPAIAELNVAAYAEFAVRLGERA
jgi:hypothetical protein